VKRLTRTPGNDAHMGWSSDGEHIVFTSARMGFKDEVIYTNAPQPYGELFLMGYDGSDVQLLADNQRQDGTPAWQRTRGSGPDGNRPFRRLWASYENSRNKMKAGLAPFSEDHSNLPNRWNPL
jgi:hypothetical protein